MAVMTLTATCVRLAYLCSAHTPDSLVLTPASAWLWLPVSFASKLVKLPGVQTVEYFDVHLALDGAPHPRVMGSLVLASDGYFRLPAEDEVRVKPELEKEWLREKQGLVTTSKIAERMHWKEGDSIMLAWKNAYSAEAKVTPFRFLGTYQGVLPEFLIVHYDYLDELMSSTERGRASALAVFRAESSQNATDQAVAQLMKGSPDPVTALPSREWELVGQAASIGTTSLLEDISVVLLIITWAIVGAAVSMSLRARRTEIATLRGLGFSRRRVFLLILLEAAALALAGYALGVLLPAATFAVAGRGVELGGDFLSDVRPGWVELILAAGVTAVLSFGISVWPALSAARQDVVTMLREG
jgi:ABC-type lipoprotein release transport system permease subunit